MRTWRARPDSPQICSGTGRAYLFLRIVVGLHTIVTCTNSGNDHDCLVVAKPATSRKVLVSDCATFIVRVVFPILRGDRIMVLGLKDALLTGTLREQKLLAQSRPPPPVHKNLCWRETPFRVKGPTPNFGRAPLGIKGWHPPMAVTVIF